MKLKKMLAGHLLVLVLAFPPVVSAEDFNLGMKTVLSNLHPDVTNVKVSCTVIKAGSRGRLIGEGSATEKVPANGEINKIIQVKFNASSGQNPADAKQFICRLILIGPNGTSSAYSTNSSVCNDATNDWKCSMQEKPFNDTIIGQFPEPSTGNSGVNSQRGGNSTGGVDPRTRSGIALEFNDR